MKMYKDYIEAFIHVLTVLQFSYTSVSMSKLSYFSY